MTMAIYTHENFATGTRAIRLGTQKDGIFIDFYSDGTWGYTVIKDGKIVTSQDFEDSVSFEELAAWLMGV
jgi:hypothetical protein